ncbi:glycosyltransferase [Oceanobacillus sp. FSL K6-3682]|uniref:glycosyltransferase n=1 Tax=Oceanobacillus sp. FSL K6-3682 TaxID=2921503 RepID=UPI0030DD9748
MKRKNRHFFYMLDSFSENSGGRTQATINRAKLLADHAKKSFILTNNFKVDYGKIVEFVKEKRNIPDTIEFINIYEFFAGEDVYLNSHHGKKTFEKSLKLSYQYDKKKNAYRVLDNGKQISYIQLDEDDTVVYQDFFDSQNRKEKREIYDNLGNIIKVSYFDMRTKNLLRQDFYTRDSCLYLSIDYNKSTGETIRCLVFDREQKIKYKFKNETEMNQFWVASLNQTFENSIFFSEHRKLDNTLIDNKYEKGNIKSVAAVHSTHLKEPYTFGSKLRNYNGKMLLNDISKFSAVVLLTKEQLKHVVNQFGIHKNLYRIPHYATKKKVSLFKKKDYNKVVVISRFIPLKRIMDILEAFKLVNAELPTVKLEIWGDGEEKELYQKFIDDNKLDKVIELKGYTNNPNETFYSGGLSIITSINEGFGMTILESLSNQTPVIAYDYNYGPRELIDHGENGMIVENGNVKELANSIIEVQKDRKLLKKLSKNAKQKIEEYKPEILKQKWLELIEDVEKQKDNNDVLRQKVLLSELQKISVEKNEPNIALKFDIENTLSSGIKNEKYYLYIKNYYNLDEIENRFIELEKIKTIDNKEWLEGVFEVNQSVFNELKKNKIVLGLGVSNEKEFYYVNILIDDKFYDLLLNA